MQSSVQGGLAQRNPPDGIHHAAQCPVKRLTADEVDQMGLAADVALAVKSNLAVIITLNEQIDVLEKRLQEKIASK